MVMAWRFGLVDAAAVTDVIRDPALLAQWMVGVPERLHADLRWPAAGSFVQRYDGQETRGRHKYNRHLIVAIVETWTPDVELVCRLRSGLGGWVRLAIALQPRPGGCLIEVRSEPLTATARLRYAGPAQSRAEDRCGAVAEGLINLARASNPDPE
ncbi:hypothetical protein AB0E69_10760 [Kribbella sp. NPDC026611]|uniref:hypothetical protein n=1 Tax=Kribbella sp. NPDC026611 TaxID=3154911 RepID=UPI0033C63BD3